MKKLFFATIIFICTYVPGRGATITAAQNGIWSTASTWDLNRVPKDNDLVIIPQNVIVYLTSAVNIAKLTMEIKGGIYMIGGSLSLNNTSTITVFATGFIDGIGLNTETIKIGNIIKYSTAGNPALTGPVKADATSGAAFVPFIPLPVIFTDFSIRNDDSKIYLQWSTAGEVNAAHFNVERSFDGTHFTTIGKVNATGTTTVNQKYSFIDHDAADGINYYRIIEEDKDGKKVATKTLTVLSSSSKNIFVSGSQGQLRIQFKNAISSETTVRLISLSGQVVQEWKLGSPSQAVLLNTTQTGIFLVNIQNKGSLSYSTKLIL